MNLGIFKHLLNSRGHTIAQNIKPGLSGSGASLLTVMSVKCHVLLRLFNGFLKNKNKKCSVVLPKAFPVYRVCILTAVLESVT